jgi:plasmid stabilization system protein ParE
VKPRIGKSALADLRKIHARSVENWGEAQAHRYIRTVWEATIDEVTEKPDRCRLRNDIYP